MRGSDVPHETHWWNTRACFFKTLVTVVEMAGLTRALTLVQIYTVIAIQQRCLLVFENDIGMLERIDHLIGLWVQEWTGSQALGDALVSAFSRLPYAKWLVSTQVSRQYCIRIDLNT